MTGTRTRPVALTPAGLVLDGEEQVLLVSSLFYFRLPREQWRPRLEQVRASGYQAVDVYLPWNFHELAPGEWDFTGRRDVAAFLDLAQEAGLAVIARPGPYICSEWDGGGLPAWLTLEPGLRLRQAEPRFLRRVADWFSQVIPILVAHERGAGGPVVAVQLENELDFFDTADRPAYLAALRDLALAHGVGVPLVACAGQGDLRGAAGGADGVTVAVNVYPDDRSPFVEEEVRRYAGLLAAAGQPLMVTETNRRHVTLRRLLVSGAKVIAPYLQASGYNFGYTPSVGNWGDPGGFMAHDYDFGGFLDPAGGERPELVEGRVLAAVVRTLGAELARAVPQPADRLEVTGCATSASPSRLVLPGGGELVGVPNLGDLEGRATLPDPHGPGRASVALPPMSCTFVLRDLPLARFGLPGTLRLSSADLVGVGPRGLDLATRVASVVVLEVPGAAPVRLDLAAPAPGAPVRRTAVAGDATWAVVVHHPQDVGAPPADPVTPGPGDGGPAVRIQVVGRLDAGPGDGRVDHHDLPPASEELGVYRGRTHYRADLRGAVELLVQGAGDIVDLTLDGVAQPTRTPFGASFLVPVAGAARLAATVETWGHANFDDARLPALRLGSRRGLGRVWSVLDRLDVGALWHVEGDGQWAGSPAPLRAIGAWSSTRLGEPVTYRRALPVDGRHWHALHLDGVPGSVTVLVDGEPHVVSALDPWLTLAPNRGWQVALTAPHHPRGLTGATLLRLQPVRGWQVQAQRDTDLVALAGRECRGSLVDLPVELEPGSESWYQVALPPGGLTLRFEGRQVRVSVFGGGTLLGRVWLGDTRPTFTGGDPDHVWLPGAWNSGSIRLLVRGLAGGRTPLLAGIVGAGVGERGASC